MNMIKLLQLDELLKSHKVAIMFFKKAIFKTKHLRIVNSSNQTSNSSSTTQKLGMAPAP